MFATARGTLASNSLWVLSGIAGRTLVQAVYFVVLARSLGAAGYGAFVSVAALVALAVPFSDLGLGNVLVATVSRDRTAFSQSWGHVLLAVAVAGSSLVAITSVGAYFLLPPTVPVGLILGVSVSDLLLARVVDLGGQAYQSVERFRDSARLLVFHSLMRLAAAAGFATFGNGEGLAFWGLLYCCSSLLAAIFAFASVYAHLGAPTFSWTRAPVRYGVSFSIGLAAQNVYNDIDKTLLARFGQLEAAGTYSAAYRLVDVAFAPVRSVLYAAYSRFFQQGALGVRSAIAFALRPLGAALAYSTAAAAVILAGADLAPLLLGRDFEPTTQALRLLTPILLLRTVHYFVGDTITGSGHHPRRAAIQIVTAIINLTLCFWLIPQESWKGAAWASVITDAFLLIALSAYLMHLWNHRAGATGQSPSSPQ